MYTAAQQRAFYELSKELLKQQLQPSHEAAESVMRDLRDVLIYHEWRYYVLNDPVVSDFEYDQLFKHLQNLEAHFPELIDPDSPTQRVSADLTEDFPSAEHLTPMLSLANSYNAEDLNDFDEQVKKLTLTPAEEDVEYVVEPKYDGGTIALVYENDILSRASTRGNGVMGEEMTANARVIRSIPLKAGFSRSGFQTVELRGEVLIRKDIFNQINKKREAEGLALFANPRNAATGGLRMKDPKETAQRGLEAFVYQLAYATNAEGADELGRLRTHDESIELLGTLGFKVPGEERKVCKGIREVIDFCLHWQARREDFPYEIDGMVVKVNRRDLQERCGYTSHHPRWAIAFKFQAKQATTKLLNVEYQVGKVGSITPVAKLEPVPLAGVTISSVSLHNEDFIRTKDLRLGDTVLVERAGDVIPYIVKAMTELRTGAEHPIAFPQFCPVNDTEEPVELVREEGESAWRCPICVCGAQDLQRLIWHVSKDAMDIEGLGKSIVERFYELGWLRTLADVYRLPYEQIEQLEGFGPKSVTNLKASIEKARQNPIQRLLHSLSIHHLGQKISKLLAAEIGHVLDLKDWTAEDFTHIKDVGPVVAENVMAWFHHPSNIQLLEEMESLGVNLRQTEEDRPRAASADAPLAGKSILFTGTLQTMGRKEAQEKAEAAGARNVSAVSSKLDILVAGEAAGSKLKKARELGTVQVLTEEEFLSLVS
ncbi:MAG: NAD-dependent DNA ligase LigA [Saprospirales bacterium]|nr:NAD-dependent DNA ligase LigA [Saprospirales bacterium]MBK8490089.1 NAD-dependent DNA ligase LigA [Saprospirales bacterium]